MLEVNYHAVKRKIDQQIKRPANVRPFVYGRMWKNRKEMAHTTRCIRPIFGLPRVRFNFFSTDASKIVDQPRGCSGHGRMEGSLNPINSNQNNVKAAVDTLSVQLSMKSVNSQVLTFYKTFLKKVLLNLNLKYTMIGMPTKIKRITLLKSPHVNKSAREQFEMKTYKTTLDVHNIHVKSLKYIIFNKPKAVTVAFKTIQ